MSQDNKAKVVLGTKKKTNKQQGKQNALLITVKEWAIQLVLENLAIHMRRNHMLTSHYSQNLISKDGIGKLYNHRI